MAYVKFASTCGKCGTRSPEYTVWHSCLGCDGEFCPKCCDPLPDDEGHRRGICHECAKDTVVIR